MEIKLYSIYFTRSMKLESKIILQIVLVTLICLKQRSICDLVKFSICNNVFKITIM